MQAPVPRRDKFVLVMAASAVLMGSGAVAILVLAPSKRPAPRADAVAMGEVVASASHASPVPTREAARSSLDGAAPALVMRRKPAEGSGSMGLIVSGDPMKADDGTAPGGNRPAAEKKAEPEPFSRDEAKDVPEEEEEAEPKPGPEPEPREAGEPRRPLAPPAKAFGNSDFGGGFAGGAGGGQGGLGARAASSAAPAPTAGAAPGEAEGRAAPPTRAGVDADRLPPPRRSQTAGARGPSIGPKQPSARSSIGEAAASGSVMGPGPNRSALKAEAPSSPFKPLRERPGAGGPLGGQGGTGGEGGEGGSGGGGSGGGQVAGGGGGGGAGAPPGGGGAGQQAAAAPAGDAGPGANLGDASAEMLYYINEARKSRGAPALQASANLTKVAQDWSAVMASKGSLSHHLQGAYGSHTHEYSTHYPAGWKKAAENVGFANTVRKIFDGMYKGEQDAAGNCLAGAQGGHCRNILDPSFNVIGIGDTVKGGNHWNVQNFGRY